MNKQPTWEDDFTVFVLKNPSVADIKGYFKQLLTTHDQELIERIGKMELVSAEVYMKSAFGMVHGDASLFRSAYNAALEEVQDLIRGN